MSPEIRTLLFMSAPNILGRNVAIGKTLEQLAQSMREMPVARDEHLNETTGDLSWHDRLLRSFDWLTVYERGS